MEVRFWMIRNTNVPNNSHNTIDDMTHSNDDNNNDGEQKKEIPTAEAKTNSRFYHTLHYAMQSFMCELIFVVTQW